jgi:hypothetical protein
LASAVLAFAAQPAQAQQIVSATSGTINSGGPGFGSLTDTINQSGLSTGYVSGVTDFNSYIAGNPTHTVVFNGNEWFSNQGSNSASVTYDLGSAMGIDALALWNEEASGIGTLNLFSSLDGVLFTSLGSFNPTNNPLDANYLAQVFNFGAVDTRYFRFDMSECPQQPTTFDACAIGEVAFRTASVSGVPEPSSWAMMLVGFGAIGYSMRRRRSAKALALA